MAHPLGFYAKQGLNVEVVKTAGWAVVRDKTINKEYDAAHMLAPMPLAISLGLGSNAIPFTVPAIENINGQAITLAIKHKDKRDPKDWKGIKFAIPVRLFDAQLPAALLSRRARPRSRTPTCSCARCRRRKWSPTCAPTTSTASSRPTTSASARSMTASASCTSCPRKSGTAIPAAASRRAAEFITTSPNSFAALTRAIVDATAYASKAENRKQIAEAIAPANYLNAPVTVLEQVLTGTYADGLGGVKTDAKRVDFDPFPWQSFAVWMLTQMKRWGQIKGDVDYKAVAEQVFLATDTAQGDDGDGPDAAGDVLQVVLGDGQDVRSGEAGGLCQELQDQEGVVRREVRHVLRRPGESRDPSPASFGRGSPLCNETHGVWVPAFAGTTAEGSTP